MSKLVKRDYELLIRNLKQGVFKNNELFITMEGIVSKTKSAGVIFNEKFDGIRKYYLVTINERVKDSYESFFYFDLSGKIYRGILPDKLNTNGDNLLSAWSILQDYMFRKYSREIYQERLEQIFIFLNDLKLESKSYQFVEFNNKYYLVIRTLNTNNYENIYRLKLDQNDGFNIIYPLDNCQDTIDIINYIQ